MTKANLRRLITAKDMQYEAMWKQYDIQCRKLCRIREYTDPLDGEVAKTVNEIASE